MSNKFSEHILKRWSSHPEALKRQRLPLFLIGLLPVTVLAVIIGFGISDIDNIIGLFTHLNVWVKVISTAVCLSVGFIFALVLMNVVSRTLARTGVTKGRDELPFPLSVTVIALLFWVAPLLLPFLPWIGRDRTLQLVLNLICLFPFLGMMCWVVFAKNTDEKPSNARHNHFFLLLGMVFIGLAAVSLLGSASDLAIKLFGTEWRWAGQLTGRLILFSTLFPFALIFLSLWRILWLPAKAKKEKGHKNRDSDVGSAQEQSTQLPPEWVEKLCNKLPDGVRKEPNTPRLKIVTDTSPMGGTGAEELSLLMGGKVPTRDQCEFFQRFDRAYLDALNATLQNDVPKPVPARADILLQGCEGSGRTEALCSVALYATLARGQQVLFIASSSAKAKIARERISKRFNDLQLSCYTSCELLTMDIANGWMEENTDTPVPSVLVATPLSIEQCFFGNNTTIAPKRLEKLRSAILRFEVVLVDDFTDSNVPGRSHLAFIIDKLRLLLVSEYILPQFVVVMPRLHSPEGEETIGARLFGEKNFDRLRNVILLRPRSGTPFWSLTLRVADATAIDSACNALMRQCLEYGLKVLMYRKGIGENARKDMERDIRGPVAKGSLKVISHLDEVDEETQPNDAVFYLSMVCGDAGFALRLAEGDNRSVYIRVASEDEEDAHPDNAGIVTLIPDESAVSLRIAHLRSILSFISSDVPIEATVWSHFGISISHPRLREAQVWRKRFQQIHLVWKHDDAGVNKNRYGENQIWAYLTLEYGTSVNTRGESVNLRILPFTHENIFNQADTERLLLARYAEEDNAATPSSRQLAVWKDERGNTICETDLAHLDSFLLTHNEDSFVPARLRPAIKGDVERYAVTITPKPYRGSGNDREFAVKGFDWEVPEAFRAIDVWERRDDGMAGFELEHLKCDFCRVDVVLRALLSASGTEERIEEIKFSYQSYLSGLLLLPTLPDKEPGKALRTCLNGRWRTDMKCGFSPALTHAITAALRTRLDGFSFFAAAPAFHIYGREGSVGAVVVWLLEPVNSGCTVYPILKKMLENTDFKAGFLDDVKQLLSQNSIKKMRGASCVAFADETYDEDDFRRALVVLKSMKLGEATDRYVPPASHPDRIYAEQYDAQQREFDEIIVEALFAFRDSIDMTKFAVEYGWDQNKICETLNDVLFNHPEIFYVSKSHKYQQWEDKDGKTTRFLLLDFQYGIKKSDYARCKKELEHEAANALAEANAVSGSVRKALALHDYIVRICEYDTEAAGNNDLSPLARTAYSVLVRRKAVCEGYAMAYRYLLNLANIQAEEMRSKDMCHVWNYVKIEGEWYHVDVTHDDPVYLGRKPVNEQISREHFLLSDNALQAKGHHGWQRRGLPLADNTRFDKYTDEDWKKS